jgi:RNA polymerase sigma-70 factor (ECF subfamily)
MEVRRARARHAALAAALLGVGFTGRSAPAFALEAEAFGRARAFYDRLPDAFSATRLTREPEDVSDGASDRLSGQLFAVGRAWGQPVDGLVLQLGLDTGLLDVSSDGVFGDGRDLGTHAAETLFLGETFVDVEPFRDGRLVMRAGKLRPRFGRGAIFDAYAFGLRLDLDLRYATQPSPWRFELWGGVPGGRFDDQLKRSPLVHGRVTFEPLSGLEIAAVGAVLVDGDDALQPAVARALIRQSSDTWDAAGDVADFVFDEVATLLESEVSTRGFVGWGGLELGFRRRGWSLELTGLVSAGSVEPELAADAAAAALSDTLAALNRRAALQISDPDARRRRFASNGVAVSRLQQTLTSGLDGAPRGVFGGLVLAEGTAPLLRDLELQGFFIWSSGEDGLAFADPDDGLSAFVTVTPLLPLTDIFFSGSTAPSQQTPSFASVAPEGSGVLGRGSGPRPISGPSRSTGSPRSSGPTCRPRTDPGTGSTALRSTSGPRGSSAATCTCSRRPPCSTRGPTSGRLRSRRRSSGASGARWGRGALGPAIERDFGTSGGLYEVVAAADEEGAWMAEFVRTRDRALFDRLYRRYRDRMVAHARRYVRDVSRAEEMAQDVFIRVYTSKRYVPDRPFKAWLYRVATNVCLNELRRGDNAVIKVPIDDLPLTGSESPAADAEGKELQARLESRLAALPDKQRAAFVLARFEGLSHDEIATALETSVSATKSLIHRALEALRAEVRAVGAAPSAAGGGR